MLMTNRIVPAVVLGIASLFIAASPSFGAAITYTLRATASGSLDGNSFTDEIVILSMSSNTTNVTVDGLGDFQNLGTVTVSVGWAPALTFTDPTQVFSDHSGPAVGFDDLSVDDILNAISASFATYDLTTSIGPIVGSSEINPESSFATTGGALVLTSAGDVTFAAATSGISGMPSGIPEPSSWAMMMIGFAGLGYAGYRRARAAHATLAA
jgi:PEP-CTERM motif